MPISSQHEHTHKLCRVHRGLACYAYLAPPLFCLSQYAHTTTLTLSAVERHFYVRQHQECASKARQVLPPALLAEASAAGLAAAPATPLQSPAKVRTPSAALCVQGCVWLCTWTAVGELGDQAGAFDLAN